MNQKVSRPMSLAQAREICISMTCSTCGASPGFRCSYVVPVANARKPAFTMHEARWKSTGYWPFTINDI